MSFQALTAILGAGESSAQLLHQCTALTAELPWAAGGRPGVWAQCLSGLSERVPQGRTPAMMPPARPHYLTATGQRTQKASTR